MNTEELSIKKSIKELKERYQHKIEVWENNIKERDFQPDTPMYMYRNCQIRSYNIVLEDLEELLK